jgi:hypothetical protein
MKNLQNLKNERETVANIRDSKAKELEILNKYLYEIDLKIQNIKDDCLIFTVESNFKEIGQVIREKDTDLIDCYVKGVFFKKDLGNGKFNEYTRDASIIKVLSKEKIK